MSDGLLLNLALPAAGIPSFTESGNRTVKGKWTQRLKTRRAIRKSTRPATLPAGKSTSTTTTPSAASRHGSGSNRIAVAGTAVTHRRHAAGSGIEHDNESGSGRGIVSSLFSSVPTPTTTATAPTKITQTNDPSNAPLAESTFESLGVTAVLAAYVSSTMGFAHPTAIQSAAIPPLVAADRDLFLCAQTGSGKTLAYVLPIISALVASPARLSRESGLFAIIIAPTRELAQQIYGVLELLVQCCHYVVPGIVIGGERKKSEKARFRKGVNILVSTPGRLLDHLQNTERLDLAAIRWLVLDEGDRLMELGFQETITSILTMINTTSRVAVNRVAGLPSRRVTVLCSATLRGDVEELGRQSLKNAVRISLESETLFASADTSTPSENKFSAPDQLHQEYYVIPMKLRMVCLVATIVSIVKKTPNARIMIFLSCSDSVNFHFSMLTRDDSEDEEHDEDVQAERTCLPSTGLQEYMQTSPMIHKLHGSLTQPMRKATLAAFSRQTTSAPSVLLCTDVASRGLDLPSISHVIEFDPPFALEDHLHRVGRTARAGHGGWASMFVLPGSEEEYVTTVMAPLHKSAPTRQEYTTVLGEAFGRKQIEWRDTATKIQLEVERWVLSYEQAMQLARSAFASHIRAYATHLASERQYFSVRDLHLGHLAKSLGLRETPAGMRLAGAGAEGEGKRKREERGPDYAKKRLLKVAMTHASVGADEFNLA
ncbi:P-loop containing nucleoside triphosphate hydrolase protein [Limtongia smithiae]|uniref:P-loop containing nucleoside triphosphate hydrolase protein n=1 Tax=Limtongia smithiae TaxID=1125753 RepID=UPI0034CF8C91